MAQFYDSGICFPSATLQAGFKDVSRTIAINNYQELTLLIAYTRGGVGGSVEYQVQFSLDGLTWFSVSEFQAAAIVPGTDVIVSNQIATIVYTATAATGENFTSPTFTVVGNFFRVILGESGFPGSPGACEIKYYLRGTQT